MPSFRWPCSDRCGTEILQALEILEAPWAGQRGLRIAVDFFQLLHWMLDDACDFLAIGPGEAPKEAPKKAKELDSVGL